MIYCNTSDDEYRKDANDERFARLQFQFRDALISSMNEESWASSARRAAIIIPCGCDDGAGRWSHWFQLLISDNL